jgi:hypothetical protein
MLTVTTCPWVTICGWSCPSSSSQSNHMPLLLLLLLVMLMVRQRKQRQQQSGHVAGWLGQWWNARR